MIIKAGEKRLKNAQAAKGRLIDIFELSDVQADYILDMPLRRLTKFSKALQRIADGGERDRHRAPRAGGVARLGAGLARGSTERVSFGLRERDRDHAVALFAAALSAVGVARLLVLALPSAISDRPTFLAHGPLVTSDMTVAFFMTAMTSTLFRRPE